MGACACRRRRVQTHPREDAWGHILAWEDRGDEERVAGRTSFMFMLYPMYVLPVADFLKMSALEPHQSLRAREVVKPLRSPQLAVFISHQWCGRRNSDPSFRQLRVLQGVFRRAAAGTLMVEPEAFSTLSFQVKATMRSQDFLGAESWAMWYDYFSVPQRQEVCLSGDQMAAADHMDLASDLGKAVSSLGSYVESCSFFIVLAPAVQHELGHFVDYSTWLERGWCRFERLSRQLSRSNHKMLLVSREDQVFEIGAHDYLMDPVGRGNFDIEADKARLAPIVQRLLRRKLSDLYQRGSFEECRNLATWCTTMLDGLPADWQDAIPTPILDPTAEDGSRWLPLQGEGAQFWGASPLLLGAGIGDVPLLRTMLEARGDVACRTRRDVPDYFRHMWQQPIHIAASCGHVAALSLLLEHRAHVDAQDFQGKTPVYVASCAGKHIAVEFLLDRRADLHHRDITAADAMHTASIFDRRDVVRLLLARGGSVAQNRHGANPLHHGAVFRAGTETVQLLVAAGAGLEERLRPQRCSVVWFVTTAMRFAHYFGAPRFISILGENSLGSTPLLCAVMSQNSRAVQELLSARADVSAKNSRGRGALALAELCGSSWELLAEHPAKTM